MNYYVYRITNTVLNKHYYGYRSCKIDPKEDLGKKYFSSSRDKEFIKDQKQNPLNYWALSVKPLFSEEEQLNGYMLVLRDVSETKRYEAELIEQRDKLETLYQITPLALWTMNSSHTISNYNQTAKQYFKMIAQTFAMVFDSQERNFFTTTGQLTTFAELYNKVFYGGSPICNLIVQYEKRDRWLLINALCSGGSEVAFSAMDITPLPLMTLFAMCSKM